MIEKETNESLTFLDLSLTKCKGDIDITIRMIIPKNSFYPGQHKTAVFNSPIHRLMA